MPKTRYHTRSPMFPRPLPPPPPAAEPVAKPVTDLSEFEAFCSEVFTVQVLVRGVPWKFTGRRLVPAETKEIKLLLEEALPPLVAGDGSQGTASPTEPKYDFSDPAYRLKKEDRMRKARALAIWRGFPCFRELAVKESIQVKDQKPEAETGHDERGQQTLPGMRKVPENSDEVTAWMEKRSMDEDVLETLFRSLWQSVVGRESLVGFTSGNSSPTS